MKQVKDSQKSEAKIEKTKIYNLIIIDKSGSTEIIKDEAISGYNETLGGIKSAQLKYADSQEHFVSLVLFCACETKVVYDRVPVKDAENLTKKTYIPCCCTPLYDAVGTSVQKLKECLKDAKNYTVMVTIITDGMENASKEWSGMALAKLIDEMKDAGWLFSFIGANMDAEKFAATISITNTIQWEQTHDGTNRMFKKDLAARERRYKDEDAIYCKSICSDNNLMPEEDIESNMIKLRKKLNKKYYDDDKSKK